MCPPSTLGDRPERPRRAGRRPGGKRVGRYGQRVERHGDHFVVTDEQAQLDQVDVRHERPQLGPQRVGDRAIGVQLVGGTQQRALTGRPALGVRS
jgi:hypothetical protein